jgi:hypothetical protein
VTRPFACPRCKVEGRVVVERKRWFLFGARIVILECAYCSIPDVRFRGRLSLRWVVDLASYDAKKSLT